MSNNNNTINNDPDELIIEDINRHYVPLRNTSVVMNMTMIPKNALN